MAETTEKTKKAKAPAKPKAATGAKAAAGTPKASKKKAAVDQVIAAAPTHEEIARLAEQYWIERGRQDGQAEQDWLRAEQELLKMAS